MASKRSSAKPYRITCAKCGFPFTVMAFLSKGVDKTAWMDDAAQNTHDCEEAAKLRSRSSEFVRVGQQKQKK